TPEEMKDIQTLAAAAIGLSPERGDSLAVEEMPFHEIQVNTPRPPKGLKKWEPLLKPYSGLARYAGILLIFLMVYMLILKPVIGQVVAGMANNGHGLQVTAGQTLQLAEAGAGISGGQTAGALLEGKHSPLEEPGQDAYGVRALRETAIMRVEKQPTESSKIIESWIREKRS
ncbi:MAG: flagellar M-ring protein FliF C-terminal domain-containing protein, partial [Terriglobia bacterium]